jgi:hypothetical protein
LRKGWGAGAEAVRAVRRRAGGNKKCRRPGNVVRELLQLPVGRIAPMMWLGSGAAKSALASNLLHVRVLCILQYILISKIIK